MNKFAAKIFGPIMFFSLLIPHTATANEIVISQKDKQFMQQDKLIKELTVEPGDVIVFKNDDSVGHNVYSANQKMKFNILYQKPGDETRLSLEEAGASGIIHCAIHPNMKLKVTVVDKKVK